MTLDWLFNTGYLMLEAFRTFIDFLFVEVRLDGVVLGQMWENVFMTISPFPNKVFAVSLFAIMFGSGLALYCGYVLIKFLLDIVL